MQKRAEEEKSKNSQAESEMHKAKPKYFWEKIPLSATQIAGTVLLIILCLLPIIMSLTCVPFCISLQKGNEHIYVSYEMMGALWSAVLYALSMIVCAVMLLYMLKATRQIHVHEIKNKTWLISHWLPVFMFLLLIWSILSTCFAKDKDLAVWGDDFCHEGLIMFFFYAAYFVIASTMTKKQMKIVSEVLIAVCSFIGFLVLFPESTFFPVFYMEDQHTAMFHNNNHFGYFLAICAPLVFGLALQDKNEAKHSKVLLIVRLAEIWLIYNAVAQCNTLGALIAIVLVLICWNIYVFLRQKDRRKKIILLDILSVSTLLFLNTGSTLLNDFVYLIRQLMGLSTPGGNTQENLDDLGSGRGFLWYWGFKFACRKPLFGYGPGNLIEPYTEVESTLASPHSDIILIIATLGFPALVLYLTGLAGHLYTFIHHIKKISILEAAMFAVVGSYLISSLTGVSMYYTTPYFYVFLGFSYRICKDHYNKEHVIDKAQI